MQAWITWIYLFTSAYVYCDVLDPSLYLMPSPPLTDLEDPAVAWSKPARVTRDTHDTTVTDTATTPSDLESMDSAETFWPKFGTPYGLRGVHIPLTFSVSGTYGGGYGGYGSGVASSYGTVSQVPAATGYGYGKSALAGSSYGSYGYPGVRIFGSSGKTGWSGWGNGKWGHYGKG